MHYIPSLDTVKWVQCATYITRVQMLKVRHIHWQKNNQSVFEVILVANYDVRVSGLIITTVFRSHIQRLVRFIAALLQVGELCPAPTPYLQDSLANIIEN